jgi:predicted SnoaL-like aldol condensation-catalyzing enzyme
MDQGDTVGLEVAKVLVREYFQRLLNEKDLSVCDEILSSDYIDHDAPPDTFPGPKSTKEFVTRFLEEYPDMRVDIKDIIAERNEVAARMVWRGTTGSQEKSSIRWGSSSCGSMTKASWVSVGQLTSRCK